MVTVTERAATELRAMLGRLQDPAVNVRIFTEHQCRCGTVRFGISLEREVRGGDRRFNVAGIPFVADAATFPELPAAEIGYLDDFMNRGLRIRNAIHDCGTNS